MKLNTQKHVVNINFLPQHEQTNKQSATTATATSGISNLHTLVGINKQTNTQFKFISCYMKHIRLLEE